MAGQADLGRERFRFHFQYQEPFARREVGNLSIEDFGDLAQFQAGNGWGIISLRMNARQEKKEGQKESKA